MTSDSSDISLETDMSLDSPTPSQIDTLPSVGAVVKVEVELQKLCSLLTLFEKIGCLEKHKNYYILADRPIPSQWEAFRSAAASVDRLELSSEAKREASQISPGTYIRLAQQLRGEPLFPNLCSIYVEDIDASVDYFPLLISPVLRSVQLVGTENGSTTITGPIITLRALLSDLIECAPRLHSLKITQVPEVPRSLLENISGLGHLRILELSTLALVQIFEVFRALETLPLESLSLKFTCSSYSALPSPVIPSPTFLGSLGTLSIAAPLDAVSDLLQSIGSQSLRALDIDIDLESSTSSRNKPPCKKPKAKKPPTPSSSGEEADMKLQANGLESLVSVICSRWTGTLEEMFILSPVSFTLDFSYIACFRGIERLQIKGCSVVGLEPTLDPSSAIWHHLTTLHLPTNVLVSYSLLRQVAVAAPFLEAITVFIDIDGVPPVDELKPLLHPLLSLCIHHDDRSLDMDCSIGLVEDWPRLMKVSRFLNALFPNLQSLVAREKKRHWQAVWQLIQFCHDVRADDERRQPIQVREEFEVV